MLALKKPDLLRQQAYLNGRWCDADSAETIVVTNPATGEMLGAVPRMGAAETRRAIEGAQAAWGAWRAMTAKERAAILRRWFDLMTAHAQDLALIMTAEQGKPLSESRGEIAYGAAFLEWFAEEGKRAYGDVIPTFARDRRIVVTKEPIGVCAAITPWNFPSSMITRKAGAALAAGCPLVVKPAEQTPFSALALAVLAEEAGVPAGVFSVLTGDAPAIGGEMTSNDLVRKVSFTGSTEVGRLLMRQCAPSIKKLSLELGGNAPFIVFDDADLDAAVEGAIASKYRNAGQTCVCTNRIYVHRSISARLVEALASRISALRVGDPLDADTQIGPLVDEQGLNKVREHVEDAVRQGARVVVGGQPLGGLFFQPTLLCDVAPGMRILEEETFGPVAPILEFDSVDEVVAAANDTPYGLAAYLWTRDLDTAHRVSERLDYGIVGINDGAPSTPQAPFGGMKMSGLGREGGVWGIQEYLDTKFVSVGLAPR